MNPIFAVLAGFFVSLHKHYVNLAIASLWLFFITSAVGFIVDFKRYQGKRRLAHWGGGLAIGMGSVLCAYLLWWEHRQGYEPSQADIARKLDTANVGISNIPDQFSSVREAISNVPKTIAESTRAERFNKAAWQPPELPEGCKTITVSFGGIHAQRRVGELMNKSVEHNFTMQILNGRSPFAFRILSNRLWVDIDLPVHPIGGDGLIEVRRNKGTGLPYWWDMNSSPNAIEIIDSEKTPICQLIYKSPDHVMICGAFWGGGRFYCGFPDGIANLPLPFEPKQLGLTRLFKYPSSLHRGELE